MLAATTLVGGCFPEDVPPFDDPPPPSCGNGTCEVDLGEDCLNCPAECPCCTVVDSSGEALRPTSAQGSPDGQTAALDQNSDLILVFGGEAKDTPVIGARELTFHGSVSTNDQLHEESCPNPVEAVGAFEVWVSPAGSDWRLIGIWTDRTDEFDVGCAQFPAIRWLRIKGQEGAQGLLDAIVVKPEACLGGEGS